MGFLKTRWTDSIDRNNPLPEYPRPQMERENWMSMNGVYDYAIVDKSVEWVENFDGEIVVPFAVECMLSGVEKPLKPDQKLWYKKTFSIPENMKGKSKIVELELNKEKQKLIRLVAVKSEKKIYKSNEESVKIGAIICNTK